MQLYGCDLVNTGKHNNPQIPAAFSFLQADLEQLPYPDKYFDTVICSHTLEHFADPTLVILELKRVCRNRLFILTPCQKYFYFTLDEHLSFFPTETSITDLVNCRQYSCRLVDGDWFYEGIVEGVS
ncbi:putative methyltransferase [Flavihumibacter petaseus NBRC 106054]|uniref:Putative methyltransferase n=1 Tax=Flavihumibacter petaseus NBRC 106054 TaxID=1220578 RepID=A0A0E9MVP1_9BACT|nr:putative methyltransferase [Flavihumibacter petaseus NBRC 106054]